MADVISLSKLRDPRNRAKVQQSISLINRGKAGIGGRDPRLRPFINALLQLGVRDITKLRISRPLPPITKAPIIKRQVVEEKPFSVVEPFRRPREGKVSEFLRLPGASAFLRGKRSILRTAKERSPTGKISVRKEAELLGLTALSTVVDFGKGLADLPEMAFKIAKNPKLLKEIPAQIKRSGKEAGRLLKVSPTEAFLKIGGELVLMKGTGVALNKAGKLSSNVLARLNPKFVGEAKTGQTLIIKTGAGKSVKLKVVDRIPTESLKSQVQKAGQRVSAISSQGDKLLGILKRTKILRKPIQGEADFKASTKRLLAQFDKRTITKENILKLNEAIRSEGAKGLLERTFFADPTGKIRPSRLGVLKDRGSSLVDFFTEDITFKRAKPQILLFEDIKIQNLPKNLNKVGSKLKRGITLKKSEADALLKWQLKTSRKFKPIGFLSGESEITLAPGEILKRVKKLGTTLVNGRRIPIIKTAIFKPRGKVKDLLKKLEKNRLTKRQIRELDRLLKKQTGFNYGLSSSKATARKFVDIKRVGAGILSKLKKKPSKKTKELSPVKRLPPSLRRPGPISPKKPTPKSGFRKSKVRVSKSKPSSKTSTKTTKKTISKPISRVTSKKVVSSRPISRRPVSRAISLRRPISRPSSRPRPSPTSPRGGRPPKSPPKSPPRKPPKSPPRGGKPTRGPPILIKRKKGRRLKKRKDKIGFIVLEKRGNKFVKLKGLPLTKSQAKDRLAFRLDNKISRTATIVRVSNVKKLGRLPARQRGAFSRLRKNLRNYKIVRGKRIKTPNTFIERKGKAVISTKGEKRQLALNRLAKARLRKRKKRGKRRVRR